MKNTQAKTRPIDDPYEIWVGKVNMGGEILNFEWRVLKKYQTPDNEAKNQYARWFVGARSEATFGSWEYGDTYVNEIKHLGRRIK